PSIACTHLSTSFSFSPPAHPRALPSSPTRRSSDLRPHQHQRGGKRHGHRHSAPAHEQPVQIRQGHLIPGGPSVIALAGAFGRLQDRKSTRLNSSHVKISYAVFCLKKNKKKLTLIQH